MLCCSDDLAERLRDRQRVVRSFGEAETNEVMRADDGGAPGLPQFVDPS